MYRMPTKNRQLRLAAILSAAAIIVASVPPVSQADEVNCYPIWTTGYVRTDFSDYTADGTSVYSDEARNGKLAAGSSHFPLGLTVVVEGYGVRRIADRGRYSSIPWIDVMVETPQEAYEVTGYRQVCIP